MGEDRHACGFFVHTSRGDLDSRIMQGQPELPPPNPSNGGLGGSGPERIKEINGRVPPNRTSARKRCFLRVFGQKSSVWSSSRPPRSRSSTESLNQRHLRKNTAAPSPKRRCPCLYLSTARVLNLPVLSSPPLRPCDLHLEALAESGPVRVCKKGTCTLVLGV